MKSMLKCFLVLLLCICGSYLTAQDSIPIPNSFNGDRIGYLSGLEPTGNGVGEAGIQNAYTFVEHWYVSGNYGGYPGVMIYTQTTTNYTGLGRPSTFPNYQGETTLKMKFETADTAAAHFLEEMNDRHVPSDSETHYMEKNTEGEGVSLWKAIVTVKALSRMRNAVSQVDSNQINGAKIGTVEKTPPSYKKSALVNIYFGILHQYNNTIKTGASTSSSSGSGGGVSYSGNSDQSSGDESYEYSGITPNPYSSSSFTIGYTIRDSNNNFVGTARVRVTCNSYGCDVGPTYVFFDYDYLES